MNKSILLTVLVFLAQTVWGQMELKVRDEELELIFFRFWRNSMGPDNFIDIKGENDEALIEALKTNGFDPQIKTKIMIHGFINSAETIWEEHGIAKAYSDAKKDVNLFIVDWEKTAQAPDYVHAATAVEDVGKRICKQLIAAIVKLGASLNDVQVIGHSLGSHVAGHLGKCTDGQIGRITALDPAKPLSKILSSLSLTKSDAQFVDVIHTNGGRIEQGCMGMSEAIGHVDFYPNRIIENGLNGNFELDNQHQPGCADPYIDGLGGMIYEYIANTACSHGRAWTYYVESILHKDAFESRSCLGWKRIYQWFVHVGNKCIMASSSSLYLGDNLDIEKARELQGDTRFFFTTTDGRDGRFSKAKFEL